MCTSVSHNRLDSCIIHLPGCTSLPPRNYVTGRRGCRRRERDRDEVVEQMNFIARKLMLRKTHAPHRSQSYRARRRARCRVITALCSTAAERICYSAIRTASFQCFYWAVQILWSAEICDWRCELRSSNNHDNDRNDDHNIFLADLYHRHTV